MGNRVRSSQNGAEWGRNRTSGRTVRLGLMLGGLGVLAACSRPKPPTLRPEQVTIVGISPAGVDLIARISATNPNSIGFKVQSVEAKIKLDGRYELGPVVVAHPVALPPSTPVMVDVPMSLKWLDLSALGQLASANKDVAYDLDGAVSVGAEQLNFKVPFQSHGVMRRDDLVRAAFQSLPKLLPVGLP